MHLSSHRVIRRCLLLAILFGAGCSSSEAPQPASLTAVPDSLTFTHTDSIPVIITKGGAPSFTWFARSSERWVRYHPVGGIAVEGRDTVWVVAHSESLSVGVHAASVVVGSAGEFADISVVLTVAAKVD